MNALVFLVNAYFLSSNVLGFSCKDAQYKDYFTQIDNLISYDVHFSANNMTKNVKLHLHIIAI